LSGESFSLSIGIDEVFVANGLVADPSTQRYGAAGFVSATLNVFVGNFAAWIWFPYFLLYLLFVPLIVVDLVAATILARRPGKSGQVGRGLLIGLLSVPLSPAVIAIGYFVAGAIGPI
jgi:uncharacterized protein YqgC (DUF456 family)